jgi:hypothetical protein
MTAIINKSAALPYIECRVQSSEPSINELTAEVVPFGFIG